MRGKNRIGFYVFTLGVLMLLARPYLVYQMTAARNMEPARAFSLLQRLVKKKDDLHEEQLAPGCAIFQSKTSLRPERRLLASLSIFLLTLFDLVVQATEWLPRFVILPQRQRYRLTSCLLI